MSISSDASQAPGIETLTGVGPALAARLAQVGIQTVPDLLFHLPLRYEDRTRIHPIGSLRAGDRVAIAGVVDLSQVRFGRRRSLLVHVSDGTGSLLLRFFHFNKYQQKSLEKGASIRCFGEVRYGPTQTEMVHPEYRLLREHDMPEVEDSLTPVYPLTEGVSQHVWRKLATQALDMLAAGRFRLPELLPPGMSDYDTEMAHAMRYLHKPPPDADLVALEGGTHPMQQRLVFEELLAHQASLRQLRQRARQRLAISSPEKPKALHCLLEQLPFQLTSAQRRVAETVSKDLSGSVPMLRLVQGDVGSGKTVVAALAALQVLAAGGQVALMAPTEMLAEQHLNGFSVWLAPLGIEVVGLSAKTRATERQQLLGRLASGEPVIVIGTHAVFQHDVQFSRLALVIVDEQHRFGVHQRLLLASKGGDCVPHQLVMTATPIPRSLAMTAYADLDLSIIDELPPGRTPVTTTVIEDTRRAEVVERVSEACRNGRQAYWVCTLIQESESLQCQAAEDTATQLAQALPGVAVGLVHGRLKPQQKAQVMDAFRQGEIKLLVATTVIEVGVDVPSASLMIIENAERLGLAQLHQLRGRVGRGAEISYCLLMFHAPLSENGRRRLAIMRETNDGFRIAREDLKIRGPGEVLGTRQTGIVQMRIADLLRDQSLLPQVQSAADELVTKYPERLAPLVERWIGERVEYVHV